MFLSSSWNILSGFYKKLNKFQGQNLYLNALQGRFVKIAVFFLSIRIMLRNFASVNVRLNGYGK